MYVNIVKEESMKKFRLFITKTFNEIYGVFFPFYLLKYV